LDGNGCKLVVNLVIYIIVIHPKIQKYKNTKIQKYKNTKKQKYKNTKIQKYKNTKIINKK
jgi:hypothetical protein